MFLKVRWEFYGFRRPVFGSKRVAGDRTSNRAGPDGGCLVRRSYNSCEDDLLRGMAERTNALVLKTSGDNTPVGSNPTAPARRKPEDVTPSVDQCKQVTNAPTGTALARSTKAPKDPGSNREPTDVDPATSDSQPTWTYRQHEKGPRMLTGSNATERCSMRIRPRASSGSAP